MTILHGIKAIVAGLGQFYASDSLRVVQGDGRTRLAELLPPLFGTRR
ncbi:MAG: hypothetical protein VB032_01425 [Burkholderiaceae bacterium]|nr:hypothetical protein [Burkholderiaceae bacterium]